MKSRRISAGVHAALILLTVVCVAGAGCGGNGDEGGDQVLEDILEESEIVAAQAELEAKAFVCREEQLGREECERGLRSLTEDLLGALEPLDDSSSREQIDDALGIVKGLCEPCGQMLREARRGDGSAREETTSKGSKFEAYASVALLEADAFYCREPRRTREGQRTREECQRDLESRTQGLLGDLEGFDDSFTREQIDDALDIIKGLCVKCEQMLRDARP